MKTRNAHTIAEIYENEHFVELYDQDKALYENLGKFIGGGLQNGDPCIVIATAPHLKALEGLLEQKKFDLAKAKQQDILVCLNASETLDQFIVNGLPNRERFEEIIGSLIERLSRNGQTVKAFGEMVSVLWEQNNQSGAVLLEQLWNNLAREYRFTLYCAYRQSHFGRQAHKDAIQEISSLHTSVITSKQVTGESNIRVVPALS